jgi:hypothetical protein
MSTTTLGGVGLTATSILSNDYALARHIVATHQRYSPVIDH